MKIGLTLRPACVLGVFSSTVELFSGDRLSRTEVDASGLVKAESAGLHFGCADVADSFHMMRLSVGIRHFFSWPGVSNRYLKMTEIEGNQSFARSNSLAEVLLATNGSLLEPPLRSVRKSDTFEPTAVSALLCGNDGSWPAPRSGQSWSKRTDKSSFMSG